MTTQLPSENPILTLSREPQNSLWIIEMHHGEDNRLTQTLINKALKPALDIIEREWRETWRAAQANPKALKAGAGGGAVILIGKRSQDKFFSNGLDYEDSRKDYNFFPQTYNTMLTRLISFPLPIIVAINGHCFAGGFILAMACDYRVMTDGKQRRAWLCMNEVHFGGPWPQSLAAVARAKVSNAQALRSMALEGHRFTPDEALKAGIIDAIADGSTAEAVFNKAREVALQRAPIARMGVWGLIKKDLYRHTLEDIAADYRQILPEHADQEAKARL